MGNINWKVRLNNPVCWVQGAVAVLLPSLADVGLTGQDRTSWGAIGQVLCKALGNPVVIASVIASVWNAINDPTTAGLKDSQRALGYTQPYRDEKAK